MAEYEIHEKLGEGGMGVVHRATQVPLGREVALKRLHADRVVDDVGRRRFLHEIQSLMRLSHPGVIRIYDAGELDGALYYSMDFIADARPLAQVIGSEGPLTVARSLALLRQLLEALIAIHDAGMLHRDLKPSNMLVTRDDQVLVMDFGLVKDEQASIITGAGDIVGSIPFMAPEMILGSPASRQSDLWAVGLVLYEMLTRQHGYSGTVDQLVKAIVNGPSPRVSALRPDTPPEVQYLLGNFLQMDVRRRFSDARSALGEVITCEELLQGEARPKERGSSPSIERKRRRDAAAGARRRWWIQAVAGMVAVISLVGGGMLAWRLRGPGATTHPGAIGTPAPLPEARGGPSVETLRLTTRMLRQLSPYSLLRSMARDFGQSMRRKDGEEPPDPARAWDPRLAALRDGAHLDATVEDMRRIAKLLARDPVVTREDLLAYHHPLSDLYDLERLIARLPLKWKPVVPALELPIHRSLGAAAPSELPGPLEGAVYRFSNQGFPIAFEKVLDGTPSMRSVPTGFPSPLLTFVDPRDPPLPDGIDFGGGVLIHKEPIDEAARGADRVDVLMASAMKGASIRLLVAADPKAPHEEWRPIARTYGTGVEPMWIGHSLPPALLEPSPLYLRVEAIPDQGGFLEPQGMGETMVFVWAVLFRRTEGRSFEPPELLLDDEQVLQETLDALDLFGARSLTAKLGEAIEKARQEGGSTEKIRSVRVWWETESRRAFMASDARRWIEKLAPRMPALRAGGKAPLETLEPLRRDLQELEDLCRAQDLPFPPLASRLSR